MPSQVQTNNIPQALPSRSKEHTARNALAGGGAAFLGTISGIVLVVIDNDRKQYSEKIFGAAAPLIVPTIVASAAVGTTAWILSRMDQRQAENAPSLEFRNIKTLVNSPKVSSFK